MKLVLATRSGDKAREIQEILAPIPDLEVLSLSDLGIPPDPREERIEVFDSFEENAVAKARYFHQRTGRVCVADDSGLEVEALGGAPGVRSKRFSPREGLTGGERDRENNRFLLERLEGVPPQERGARYVCVAAVVGLDPDPLVVRGEAPGVILPEPRGEGGFGYDPLFFDPELGRGFAEISAGEKHARSHRGRAFRALLEVLKVRAGQGTTPNEPTGSRGGGHG